MDCREVPRSRSSVCLFLVMLGLLCCVQVFSRCREWGLLFAAVQGLLIVVASLVAEHGLSFSGCDPWALVARGMWNLPGSGIEWVSPALLGRFLATVPPGKSPRSCS